MAISLVGTASNNAASGDLTVTLPGGTAQDDVVYGAYGLDASADQNMATDTAGYTELADLFADDSSNCLLGVFRKVQGSTPDTTIVYDNPVANDISGVVMVLRGVNTTTPEDATTTTAQNINGPTPDPPSITTVNNNAWVLACGGSSEPDVPTAPTNYTDLIEDQRPGEGACVMIARREITVAGAENPGTFGGLVGTTADAWCAATVAVRPAAVAAGGGFPFRPASFLPMLVR